MKGIDLDFDSDFRMMYFTSDLVNYGPLGSGYGGILYDNSSTTKQLTYLFQDPRDINGTYTFTDIETYGGYSLFESYVRGYFKGLNILPTYAVLTTWKNTKKADEVVLSNLKEQREQLSGVNLDEEAANLLKYQQLYSASTKILQTGNQMFNTLLAIMN